MKHTNQNLRGKSTVGKALCWFIKTKSHEYHYTDFHENLIINDKEYFSGQLVKSSSFEKTNDLTHNNYEFSAIFDGEAISNELVLSGEFDQAYIEVFVIDVDDSRGIKTYINCGYIDKITFENNVFSFNVSGISRKLDKEITQIYSPFCRANFGDNRCGVDSKKHQVYASVERVLANNKILVSYAPSQKFIGGKVKARNNDYIIISVNNQTLELDSSFAEGAEYNDEVILEPNCDKSFSMCCKSYNNAINFRGEPDIPGVDKILQTAGTR
ncbi:MAG: DUF2163 domain-containing protein [Rickettsiales bacterium]